MKNLLGNWQGDAKMHLLTTFSTKLTGYSNGDAIWPVPGLWSNTDPWIRGRWLLHRGGSLWALCTWLLPHILCWLRPNIRQPGMKINCWKLVDFSKEWMMLLHLIQFLYSYPANYDLHNLRHRKTPMYAQKPWKLHVQDSYARIKLQASENS